MWITVFLSTSKTLDVPGDVVVAAGRAAECESSWWTDNEAWAPNLPVSFYHHHMAKAKHHPFHLIQVCNHVSFVQCKRENVCTFALFYLSGTQGFAAASFSSIHTPMAELKGESYSCHLTLSLGTYRVTLILVHLLFVMSMPGNSSLVVPEPAFQTKDTFPSCISTAMKSTCPSSMHQQK